ncbi:MAG: SDR family oxidoreductase [Lachnospiraceae bacterium]|nr:SDR family oxidoreductase [Lachnospiraceae bacterium]
MEKEQILACVQKYYGKLYGVEEAYDVSLIKYSENIIFKITFPSGKAPVVFRVHRPGYHTSEEILGEIIWMKELQEETDLLLPKVFPGKDGGLLQEMGLPDGQNAYVSVISFLNGNLLGALEGEDLEQAILDLGEMTAKMHKQSMNRKGKKLKRTIWDEKNYFGDDGDGIWGSWRDYKGLTKEQFGLFNAVEVFCKRKLREFEKGKTHFGLTHCDLHFCNIICDGEKKQIIDFDDAGYSYYLYDFGCSLVTYSKDLDVLTEKWVAGYEKVRKLSAKEKDMLPVFLLIRRFVRLAWLASHSESDTAKTVGEDYLTVTEELCRKILKEDREKVAVVTGAGQGLGLGVAERLCEEGRRVILLGRSESVLKEASRLKKMGYLAEGKLCDITKTDEIRNVVSEILRDYGKIHILVNNAGVAKISSFEETTDDLLNMQIGINIIGTWKMTQMVIPAMRKQAYGRIINISSVTGPFECDPGYAAYATTKAALLGFTKAIASEYAKDGITVNAVCPGFMKTPNVERNAMISNPDDPEMVLNEIAQKVPLKRMGTKEDVGAMVSFLASEDAGYVTGEEIIIDGGNIIPETGVMGCQ